MKTEDVLRGMRAKIEQCWTQGATARNSDGGPVIPESRAAVRWCLVGAACAVSPDATHDRGSAYAAIVRAIGENISIQSFNDRSGMTQEKILEAIDKAIYYVTHGERS